MPGEHEAVIPVRPVRREIVCALVRGRVLCVLLHVLLDSRCVLGFDLRQFRFLLGRQNLHEFDMNARFLNEQFG